MPMNAQMRITRYRKGDFMGPYEYIVSDIRGEYAYLTRTDVSDSEEFMIALILLPHGSDIGVKIKYENLEYSIIN